MTNLKEWLLENRITHVGKLNQKIKEMFSSYNNILEQLKQIPGLCKKTIEDIITEIGLDIRVFPSEKHLDSWVRIVFDNNESAGKKSGCTIYGNKQAKSNFVEIAWTAPKATNSFYQTRYRCLSSHRGKETRHCSCS